jgi:hypothetical protein
MDCSMQGTPVGYITVAVTPSVTVSIPVCATVTLTVTVGAAVLLPISLAAPMPLTVPIAAAVPFTVRGHGRYADAAASLTRRPTVQLVVLPLTPGDAFCCFAFCCASKARFRRLNFVSLSCSVSKCVTYAQHTMVRQLSIFLGMACGKEHGMLTAVSAWPAAACHLPRSRGRPPRTLHAPWCTCQEPADPKQTRAQGSRCTQRRRSVPAHA